MTQRKRRILSALEIQQQQPVELKLEALAPDDKTLPKPRGQFEPRRPASDLENLALKRTFLVGGLVPQKVHARYWRCPGCQRIFDDRYAARLCCSQAPCRVQICAFCRDAYREIYRIGDCQCPTHVITNNRQTGNL